MVKEGFERFSVYSFSVDYPAVCRIEFNPKGRREAGDVAFHFPDREKIFLSWGKLEDARKRFATPEDHAEHSVEVTRKNRAVKNLERANHDSLEVNSHRGAYNRVKMEELSASLFGGGTGKKREALSLHLHCEQSGRYFVMYALLSPNAPADFADLFLDMARSFQCH